MTFMKSRIEKQTFSPQDADEDDINSLMCDMMRWWKLANILLIPFEHVMDLHCNVDDD